MSIREVEGRTLIHDFAGCASADVVAAVGLSLSCLFDDRQVFESPPKPNRVPLRDLVPLLRHEAHIVTIIGADMLSARHIDEESWGRLTEVLRRIEGVSRELG